MQPEQSAMEQLKERMRATWMAGDFGQIARYAAKEGEKFVSRLDIKAGDRVLDVACGSGNLAIPAARAGAIATGVDIAPNLLEQARQRAAAEGLTVAFDEGDAEQLPYADGVFDLVMSSFGAMFAPRPELVAAELIRVCRPGGTIAMMNWAPDGFVGKVFALGARFVLPPEGIPAPVQWGDDAVVRARLASGTSEIRTTRREMEMQFPFPPSKVVHLFRTYFGPVQVAFSKLDSKGQAEYAAALEKLWTEHNEAAGDATFVRSAYLEVIAIRA